MTDTDEFWSARPVLTHIHQLARSRRAGPWATLLVALARARLTIPYNVALPSTVGGRMSLNIFVGLVGPSGAGKGAAEAAAADGIRFSTGRIDPIPVGSGEGVARTFRPAGTKPDDPNPVSAALFSAAEVDSLSALSARTGSTLSAELRKLYSGEPIGFANAAKETRNVVAAHSYAAAFVVGVQPLRSDALLGNADGGLPQRFAFAPVSDREAPEVAPDDPGIWTVKVPAWTREWVRHLSVVDGNQRSVEIPERAIAEIHENRLGVLREDPKVDPLDGHRLLTQLKIAASLMALDGRTIVNDEDWDLAAVLMEMSVSTRERCQSALREHRRTVNTARALATADRDEVVADRKLQRAKQSILRWLEKLTELPSSNLRRRLRADLRDYFGAAIAELTTEGIILEVHVRQGVAYRLRQGGTRVHESTPPNEQVRDGVHESTRVPDPNVDGVDNPRSDESDHQKMSARHWLSSHIEKLRDGGNTTAQEFAVYAAGASDGHSLQSLKEAAEDHPDIVTLAGSNGETEWSIAENRSGAAS